MSRELRRDPGTGRAGEPPHDIAAEEAVLGSMMLSADAITAVSAVMEAADHYRPQHQDLHRVIIDLHDRGLPTDPVSVADELRRRGQLRQGVLDGLYLHTLTRAAVPASAAHHAGIVRDCADRRDLLEQAEQLRQSAADPGADPATVRARALDALTSRQRDEQTAPAVHLAAIPDYPAATIPGPLGELVAAGRDSGLQPAFIGGAGLAALATVAGLANLRITASWTERPALWIPLIGPRGSGKTPAQTFSYRLLRELDAERQALYGDEMCIWQETPRRERGERPKDESRRIDDVTLEMVARWLSRGDGTGGVDVDELSGWLRGMGRYRSSGDGGDRARWLSLWSAQPWRYQRVTGDIDIPISRPVLAVCGGLQPPLHHLLGGEEDGLRPRWLPHLAMIGRPRPLGEDRETRAWDNTIRALYEARKPRTWTLEGAGRSAWELARARWGRDSSDGAESASVSAALAKADTQAARIALVLAESMNPAQAGAVPAEAVTAAIAITDYVLDCWRALPDREALTTSRRDETLHRGVEQLAEWLEQHGGRATSRDLQRAHVAGVRTAADLTALLSRYEAEFPGSVRTERTEGRGRPPQVAYAPRRAHRESQPVAFSSFPDLSPGDKTGKEGKPERSRKIPANRDPGASASNVASGDKRTGDINPATKSATESSCERWPDGSSGASANGDGGRAA